MFLLAAMYNLVLGAVFLVFFAQLMSFFHMPIFPREAMVFHQMAILLAMVFGVGYFMVSRDLYKHTGIATIGALGKTVVFFLFLYHMIFSRLPPAIFLIGCGDLVFALLFCKFLLFVRTKDRDAA
jgi:uncharacterized membrane protein